MFCAHIAYHAAGCLEFWLRNQNCLSSCHVSPHARTSHYVGCAVRRCCSLKSCEPWTGVLWKWCPGNKSLWQLVVFCKDGFCIQTRLSILRHRQLGRRNESLNAAPSVISLLFLRRYFRVHTSNDVLHSVSAMLRVQSVDADLISLLKDRNSRRVTVHEHLPIPLDTILQQHVRVV
jgi:hypothetical protein